MAWEEDYRRVDPCFCGKGKRISIGRSNDWGQSESNEYLECDTCKQEWVYVYCDPHNAMRRRTDGYRWVKRAEWEAHLRAEAEEKARKQQEMREKLRGVEPPTVAMTKKAIIEQLVHDFGRTPDYYGAWRKKDMLVGFWHSHYREETGSSFQERSQNSGIIQ